MVNVLVLYRMLMLVYTSTKLGQCKARPFNFVLVCFFFFFFFFFFVFVFVFVFCFSAPTDHGYSAVKAKPMVLGSRNLVQRCIWMMSKPIQNIKVIGQRSRSRGQKTCLHGTLAGLPCLNIR